MRLPKYYDIYRGEMRWPTLDRGEARWRFPQNKGGVSAVWHGEAGFAVGVTCHGHWKANQHAALKTTSVGVDVLIGSFRLFFHFWWHHWLE